MSEHTTPTRGPGDGWVEIEVGPGKPPLRYVGNAPSARFPVYTRGNAGEVYPEVVWPLSFTTAFESGRAGFEDSQLRAGILRHGDLDGDMTALNGVFGGYAYLNLSAIRVVAKRSPGVSLAEVDSLMLGPSTADPYVADRRDRSVRGTLGSLAYGLRTLRTTSQPQLDDDVKRVRDFLATLPDPATATDAELWSASQRGMPLAAELFSRHLYVSGQAGVPLALLTRMCRDKLHDESMVMRVLTGAGGVASAAPSQAMWDLSRMVNGSRALSAAFDAGVSGLMGRIDAMGEDAAPFRRSFDLLLREFGARGPNEWDTAVHTWGTKPELALALIDRMRAVDASHDPRSTHDRLQRERETALAEAAARLGARRGKKLRKLADQAQMFSQGRERAKTTVVEMIHGSRVLLRELGRRCASRANAAGVAVAADDDLWFVVRDEVAAYIADPASFAARIAERRAARSLLASLVPPFTFSGKLPPLDEWERRDRPADAKLAAGAVLTGIPGCPGVARGRARVVLDPGDPGALGPGDVLVAPITDPAWTPLFLSAEAVVVDVGAQLSHAIIVSRELGIPCVVSVHDATRVIPDGALIEVDGTTGSVTVLSVGEGLPADMRAEHPR